MEFKCIMSLEKAIVLKKHPDLLIQFLELKHKNKIIIYNIYYNRSDRNLKMKSVLFCIEYDTN